MPGSVNDPINTLTTDRRRKVERRAPERMAGEITLHELRQACGVTQVKLASTLGVAPREIAEIEKRSDMHISTLRRLIEAMGGKLSLVAEFPDRPPVTLSGIAGMHSKSKTQVL